jgi:hypothetical protein
LDTAASESEVPKPIARKRASRKTPVSGNKIVANRDLFEIEPTDRWRKPTDLINSIPRATPTLYGQRMLDTLASHMQKVGPAESYSMPRQEFLAAIGATNTRNIAAIKEACKSVLTLVLNFDVLDSNRSIRKAEEWDMGVLFSRLRLTSNQAIWNINRDLPPHILDAIFDPSVYGAADNGYSRRMSSASHIRLLHFLCRFERIGTTGRYDWRDLAAIIVGESAMKSKTYSEYKYFKSKILKPGLAAIETLTPYRIDMREHKEGRVIVALSFAISSISGSTMGTIEAKHPKLLERLGALGLYRSEVARLVHTVPAERLIAALDATEQRLASDSVLPPVNRIPAYFRSVLENKIESWTTQEQEDAKAIVKESSEEGIEEIAKRLKSAHAKQLFEAMTESERSELIERYNSQQRAANLRYKEGATGPREIFFFGWLSTELWDEPTPQDLLRMADMIIKLRAQS